MGYGEKFCSQKSKMKKVKKKKSKKSFSKSDINMYLVCEEMIQSLMKEGSKRKFTKLEVRLLAIKALSNSKSDFVKRLRKQNSKPKTKVK